MNNKRIARELLLTAKKLASRFMKIPLEITMKQKFSISGKTMGILMK